MPNQFFSPEGDIEKYFLTESWLIDQYIGDTLWTWGNQNGNIWNGRLGAANTGNRSTPITTFSGGVNWRQVSAGYEHTLAVKTDGTLWAWGNNLRAQLGVNDATRRSTPVTTRFGGTNWKSCAAGGTISFGIKIDGTLWGWGRNQVGQLGDFSTVLRSTPITTFLGGNNWKQVSTDGFSSAAIKIDGTLWVWGNNNFGQLGTSDTTDRSTPATTFLGGNNWKQICVGGLNGIVAGVAVTGWMSAIKTDGTLWSWGNGINGQLGINAGGGTSGTFGPFVTRSTPVTTFLGGTNWKFIGGGTDFNTAIKEDGTLWIWGGCTGGQLGINDGITRRSTPITTLIGGTNWKQVRGGSEHVAAIKTDGTLWTWGNGTFGALGVFDTLNRSTPVTIFSGGTYWRQVACGDFAVVAVSSGVDPTLPIS